MTPEMTVSEMNQQGGGHESAVATDEIRDFEQRLLAHGIDGFRLARYLGRSPQDAADVVQEASILAWRYRATRRGEWKPWFLAIVRRVAHRRQKAWVLIPSFWQPDSGAGVDELGASDLAQAMAGLPRRQRAAVWLRYGQDLTCGDVGRILGIRESAAKMLVARGRAAIRAALTADSGVKVS